MTYGTLNYLTVWDRLECVYDKARCDLQSNEDRTVASPPFWTRQWKWMIIQQREIVIIPVGLPQPKQVVSYYM